MVTTHKICIFQLLKGFLHCYRNSDAGAYHRVVAHAEETHHFHMCRNRGRSCELGVRVHPAHGVCHTVGGWSCCHVVRVQRSSSTAA